LLLELLSNEEYELVGNSVLLGEYEKWARMLSYEEPSLREAAMNLYFLLKNKVKLVEPDKEHIEACEPYFQRSEKADLYHAATCLKTGATLISNDRHFEAIGRAKLIRVLKTSEAIGEILG